jgi:UDPglucose 6-dehydrogenase
MKNIGIIGLGFVGGSINRFFSGKEVVYNFDIKEKSNCDSMQEVFKKSEIIFICLPTPMKKNGECDISIIKKVLSEISEYNDLDKSIVLKSTIPVGTCEKFSKEFKLSNLVFNPEFLTEANAYDDFINQDRIILGGKSKYTSHLSSFFNKHFHSSHIIQTDHKTAELVKYVTNCFLAVKVSFANEIYTLAEKESIDYERLIDIVTLDSRVGNSHWSVPGPDGKFGFGGSCFPKDINALNYIFQDLNLPSEILSAAIKRNETIDRPEKDWKKLKGRAVSD